MDPPTKAFYTRYYSDKIESDEYDDFEIVRGQSLETETWNPFFNHFC